MPSVYVETSIISYLAARPSRDLIVAARQQLTHTWWRERRPVFDLYVSQVVVDEILAGDPDAAERRAALAAGIPLLDITSEVADLAGALIQRVPLPTTAGADAAHIATAAYHRMEELRPRVERVCRENGYPPPVLCTPDELMGGSDD